jgi:hypothetical protein
VKLRHGGFKRLLGLLITAGGLLVLISGALALPLR